MTTKSNPVLMYASEVFELLGEEITNPPRSYLRIQHTQQFDDYGDRVTVYESFYNYFMTFHEHTQAVFNLPSANDAARYLLETENVVPPTFSEPETVSEQEKLNHIKHDVHRLIFEYFKMGGSTQHLDEDLFITVYDSYVGYWKQRETERAVVVPLAGFDADFDRLELDDTLSIEPLMRSEKNRILSTFTPAYHAAHLGQASYAIKTRFREKRRVARSPSYWRPWVEAALTALRLTFEGTVGAYKICKYELDKPYIVSVGGIGTFLRKYVLPRTDIRDRLHIDEPLQFKFEQEAEFIELYQSLAHLLRQREERKHQSLFFALDRFNKAFSRTEDEDRIVDLVIALEGTLLSDNPRGELKKTAGLRAAALLAERMRAEEAHEVVHVLYKARSSIVHRGQTLRDIANGAGYIKTGDIQIEHDELLSRATSVVRKLLAEFVQRLDEDTRPRDIAKGLDAEILERVSRVEDSGA
jgi:hypothetical protein